MRWLLKCTVRTAVAVGLLDLEVQAVDGTKVAANAARDQTCDAAKLERLLAKTEDAIGELENQNEGGGEPSPPHLPAELQQAQVLRERIQHAMNRLRVLWSGCCQPVNHKYGIWSRQAASSLREDRTPVMNP